MQALSSGLHKVIQGTHILSKHHMAESEFGFLIANVRLQARRQGLTVACLHLDILSVELSQHCCCQGQHEPLQILLATATDTSRNVQGDVKSVSAELHPSVQQMCAQVLQPGLLSKQPGLSELEQLRINWYSSSVETRPDGCYQWKMHLIKFGLQIRSFDRHIQMTVQYSH